MLLLKVTNLASDLRFLQFFCVCQIENIFLILYLLFTFLKYTNSAITSDLPKSGNNGMSEQGRIPPKNNGSSEELLRNL